MAMRRFVCVNAMVNPPLRSIHPCEHRIAGVRLELFGFEPPYPPKPGSVDRKSTRLNSSHQCNSYAVFCLKKKYVANTHPTHMLVADLSLTYKYTGRHF